MSARLEGVIQGDREHSLPKGFVYTLIFEEMGEHGCEYVVGILPEELLRRFTAWARKGFDMEAPPERLVWMHSVPEPPWFRAFIPVFRDWLRRQP